MPYLEKLDKNKIYYERRRNREGEEVLVLLHGLRSNLAWWDPNFLSKLAFNYELILIDLRGSGRSTNINNKPFTFEDLALDVKLVLDHLMITQTHLLGFSMGGRVVQTLLVHFPTIFNKAILACTLCEAKNYLIKDNYKEMTSKEFVRYFLPRFFTQEFIQSNPDKISAFLYRAEKFETPFETYVNQINAIPTFQGCNILETVFHETLVLYGEEDSFISPENSKKIHSYLPNSILTCINNTGHFIFDTEKIDQITDLINNFLQKSTFPKKSEKISS